MNSVELPYVSATRDFSNEEVVHLARAVSKALTADFRTSTTALESIDVISILTIGLGGVTALFIGGFLAKMGSDSWDAAKKDDFGFTYQAKG